jgi:hypothetical protein
MKAKKSKRVKIALDVTGSMADLTPETMFQKLQDSDDLEVVRSAGKMLYYSYLDMKKENEAFIFMAKMKRMRKLPPAR